jgi:hypothetical protein
MPSGNHARRRRRGAYSRTPCLNVHGARGPHASMRCVTCHVGPGVGAFLSAKLTGSRQLALVMSGDYHRPIPTPIDNLPAAAVTCEQCHWPDRYIGDVTEVFYEHVSSACWLRHQPRRVQAFIGT